jgi:PAS domain S-box-containing protein
MNNQTLSGIEVLGEISWGTHLCQFYETKRDLLEILIPYFKTGLENREFCLWIVSSGGLLTSEEAKKALAQVVPDLELHLADGDIEILSEAEWYLEKSVFDIERVISALDKKQKRALVTGYTGTRVSGDTLWLKEKDRKDFLAYEKRLNDLVIGRRLIVLCTYPLEKCGATVILDVVDVHRFTIARRNGKWQVIETAMQARAQAEIKRLNEENVKGRAFKHHPILDYSIAVLSVIAAAIIVLLTKIPRSDNAPLVSVFLCAVIFTTWFGGTRPGILSTLLSTIALAYFFLFAPHSFPLNPVQFLRLLLFLVPSIFIVWLSASQRNVSASLGRALSVLEGTVEKLKQTNSVLQEEISVRKLAEVALRKSEDRLRLVIDTVPALIHTGLPDGQLDFFNQRWLDFVGLSLEDLSCWKWTAAIHPEDVGGMVERWHAALATGEPYEHEARVRRADGEYRRMVHREVPLRDEGGNIVKWYSSSMDIEDRKRAEDALRQSEERFVAFMDNLPGYAWMKDLQGRYVYVNEMVRGLPGYRSLGKTDDQIWPAELAAEYGANDQQAIVTKKPVPTLEHFFLLEGKRRHMVGSKFPIFDKTGAVALLGGVGVDITERVEAEAALRESEERFRELAENIDEVFWLSDSKHTTIFYVSPAYEKLWGRSCSSLYSSTRSWMDAIHPEDRESVVEVLDDRELQSAPNMVYRVIRPDGSTRWVHARGFPVRDENGAVVRVAWIATDITERKHAEEALRKSERVLREAESLGHTGSWEHDLVKGEFFNTGENLRLFFGDDPSKGASFEDYTQAIHPDDREFVMRRHAQLLAEGGPRDIEYRVVWPDGNVHVLLGRATVVRDELGEAIRTYGTNLDITERKQAQDKLQLAYQRLSYHVENTPLAVIEFDKDLFIKRWSKRAVEIFGWNASEALGKNVYDPDFRIIYKEDEPAVDAINDELTKGAVNSNVSMNRNYTKDGNVISCEWYNSVLKDEQGEVITILSLVHNVTERKKTEEKLKDANADLHSLSSRLQNLREVERTAIAREIHDELGQQLTGLKIDALWIDKRISKEEKTIREKLSDMVVHINEAVKTVRRISTELRPSILDDLGLIATLEWQAHEFEKRTGIQSQFISNRDDLNLEVSLSTNIFRVYQEALTNVARHANATRVETVFEEDGNYIHLIVKDNGQGFDLNEIRTRHSIGLIGMKERAMMLHGDLTIEGNKPNGTVVSLKVPLLEDHAKISQ